MLVFCNTLSIFVLSCEATVLVLSAAVIVIECSAFLLSSAQNARFQSQSVEPWIKPTVTSIVDYEYEPAALSTVAIATEHEEEKSKRLFENLKQFQHY